MTMTPTEIKSSQLACLFAIQHAGNETWKETAGDHQNAHSNSSDQSLTPFQKYLCKLAEVCQSEKGGETITSLVCLRRSDQEGGGAEFLLTSNLRRDDKLAEAAKFLEDLLLYAASNPDDLNPKPLQRQILDRVIEFGFRKFKCYREPLLVALADCIRASEYDVRGADLRFQDQLKELRDRATFPLDIDSSQNAKAKCMKNCDTLIKAIEVSKSGGAFESWVENRASTDRGSDPWKDLHHYLGRIHSFRRAAASIAEAPLHWPDLFDKFSVNFFSSAEKQRPARYPSKKLMDMFSVAFPDSNITEFILLQDTDYERTLLNQRIPYTMVHAEVQMHAHLLRKEYVEPAHYWDGSPFIATSKPPCQACHFYFRQVDNNFQVQATHMNLYPKWRLPSDSHEDVLDDMISDIQAETLRLLRIGGANHLRFDSRTDSTRMSTNSAMGSRAHSRLGLSGSRNMMPRLDSQRIIHSALGSATQGYTNPYVLDEADEAEWQDAASDRHVSVGMNGGLGFGIAR